MELRPGCKNTAVGVIPVDWEVKAFGKHYAEPSRNGIYKSREYQGRGTRIVNMGEMFGFDFISDQEMNRVELTPGEITTAGLRDGDLLFGRRSIVPAGAGKCSLVVKPTQPLTFESSIIRVRLDHSNANPLFHYYFFASPKGRTVMSVIVSGTNVKGIRGSELRELEIPHPPLPEQCAIAAALSDVDSLLDGLTRLIAKKHNLKQAAMQQLLAGETRLPGFSGEWETKRLGEVLKFQVGCPFSSASFNEKELGVRLVKNRDLKSDDQIFHYSGSYDHAFQVNDGDLLVGMDGDFLPCRWDKGPALLNQRVGRIIPLDGLDREFAFYYLIAPLKEIEVATGSTTVKHLSHGDIERIEKPLPSVPEQMAIAVVLSDMDAEIAALEARREKTRGIKQGMMQQLLTGRARLVKPAPAEASA
jgi:type I restriction enzyme S subunit